MPTPPVPHLNDGHKPCGGPFRFSAPVTTLVAFAERICFWCDRKETYDPNRLIVVGKTGVSPSLLREYGMALVRKIEKLAKNPSLSLHPQIDILQDRSNGQRSAIIITVKDIGLDSHPEKFIESVGDKIKDTREPPLPDFRDVVEWVCRKPVVFNRSGELIPYGP